jgi:4'-phosphopantetheinyl transferase
LYGSAIAHNSLLVTGTAGRYQIDNPCQWWWTSRADSWAPLRAELTTRSIHLWLVPLAAESGEYPFPDGIWLDSDEADRAARMSGAALARAFQRRRQTLRHLVSGYLESDPARIRFESSPYGKPFIAGESAGGLRFNVSSSHGFALFGFTRESELGVDIELIAPDFDYEAVSELTFSQSERDLLAGVEPGKAIEGFFRAWTLKEATLKAQGLGLSGRPSEIVTDPYSEAPQQTAPGWIAATTRMAERFQVAYCAFGEGYSVRAIACVL